MIWRWLFPADEDLSRTAAIKALLLREAADLLVPTQDQPRPIVKYPTATGEKYTDWQIHAHRRAAKARQR